MSIATEALERPRMAKAKASKASPEGKRNDVSVKLDADVVRLAKMVAAARELTLAAYLSDTLGPIVERDAQAEFARLKDRGGK